MSNVEIKDANDATIKVDSIQRTDAGQVIQTQAVAVVDPSNGTPIPLATETTLALIKTATDSLLTVSQSLQTLLAEINTKTATQNTLNDVRLNTEESAGILGSIDARLASPLTVNDVTLSSSTLAALESINAVTGGLTDAQLRAAAVAISGTVALDATSLAALETITANTGGLTDAQLRAVAVNVTGSLGLFSSTISQLNTYLTNAQLRAAPVPVVNATLADINSSINRMTETMVFILSQQLNNMPKITANDLVAIDATETKMAAVTEVVRLTNVGSSQVFGVMDGVPASLHLANAAQIYNNIHVS